MWAIDTLIRYPLLFGGKAAELIVFSEHAFLCLFFAPIAIKSWQKFWSAKVSHVFYFFVIGGLGSAIATLAFTKAFAMINPSLVILLQKLQPLVAISLAYVVLKERMKTQFFLWAILALCGGILISYQDLMPAIKLIIAGKVDISSSAFTGYGLTMVAVFSWGAATVFGKLLGKEGYDEKEIMTGRFFMGFICLLPFLLSFSISFPSELNYWLKILFLAGISGGLGMYLYYKGLKLIPAHLCTLAEMFFPFLAVIVNWIFLGKDLTMLQLSGALLLLISSTVIQLRHY